MEGIIGVMVFMLVFGVLVVIGIAVAAIKIAGEMRRKQTQESKSAEAYRAHATSSTSSGKPVMTDDQRRRLEYLKEQQRLKEAAEKHERHVEDAHEHDHVGEEEHYEEIVGSLGDVNDEGCEDLAGVPLHPGAARYYREIGLID